jgi:putative transposase
MDVADAKRLKTLQAENARLKKPLAESMLENEGRREALRKNGNRPGTSQAGVVDADERTLGTA